MPSNRLPDGTLVVVSHDAKGYLSATGVADTLRQAPLGHEGYRAAAQQMFAKVALRNELCGRGK
ncbi:hypothetical protein C100_19565 [Sphingobium sp. C100]|jgi:hypothetical protein|uniref:hypothetical protein n=1 Tax=Sphingobium sp. C100 TaxID=1207055 RepID=UPI0003D66B8A|nr:hypothetical protein [Sphingobium sp. C100]ETI60141.1 hypothetical protein C100_19565 [Sphingobium sp. C100]